VFVDLVVAVGIGVVLALLSKRVVEAYRKPSALGGPN